MLVGQLSAADSEMLLQLIKVRYKQVIEVNLTLKYCRVIWPESTNFTIDELWEEDRLFSSDVKSLRKLHNVEYVKKQLQEKDSVSYKFRYRIDEKRVEWMQLEVIKSISYRERNVSVVMFLKNIEDSFGNEYRARKAAEHKAETDPLTGYYNRLAFDEFCKSCKFSCIGIAYIDLNKLKEINDLEGHEAGDDYIKKCCDKIDLAFSSYRRYRVGGDEFVVVAPNISFDEFSASVAFFNRSIISNENSMPICAIGHIWTADNIESINRLIQNAEKKMYRCKEADYLRYHEDRRRRDRRHNT